MVRDLQTSFVIKSWILNATYIVQLRSDGMASDTNGASPGGKDLLLIILDDNVPDDIKSIVRECVVEDSE